MDNDEEYRRDSKARNNSSFFKLLHLAPSKLKIVFSFLIIFSFILFSLLLFRFFSPTSATVITAKTTDFGFKNIGELATQEAYYTEIISQESYRELFNTGLNIPLTKASMIVSIDGVIKAGIDFEKITYRIDDDKHIVFIVLPDAKVLSNEPDPDSVRVWSETLNIFNPSSFESSNEVFRTIKSQAEENALEKGLLINAQENAKALISSMCKTVLPDYEVAFQ